MHGDRPLYLRTGNGQSFGPLAKDQIRALVASGQLASGVQVSEDGQTYALPGQFLHLRDLFPPELWGEAEGPLREGDLSQTSAVRAYAKVASAEASGTLEFTLPDRRLQIVFRRGNPDAVESDHPEDALEPYLRSQGVDGSALERASAERARFGGDLLAALFGLGAANPAMVVPMLGQRAQLIALKALLATNGTFRFTDALPQQKTMPLGNRWSVLVELVRRIPAMELRRRLSDVRDRAPIRSGGKVTPEQLRLTPKELRALSHLDGVQTLGELLAANAADEEHLLRLVFLLRELDALSFSEPLRSAAAPTSANAVRPPPSSPPAAASRSPAGPSRPAGPPKLSPVAPAAANGSSPSASSGPTPPRSPPQLSPSGAGSIPRPPPQLSPSGAGSIPARPSGAPTGATGGQTGPGAPTGGAAIPNRPGTAATVASTQMPGGPATAASVPSRPGPPAAAPNQPAAVAGGSAVRSGPPTLTPPATAPSRPVVSAPPPVAEAPPDFAAEMAALRAQLAKVKELTAFELLGVPDNANSAAIKIAYFKLAKQAHPDTVPPGAPEELAKLKASLFAEIGGAYRRIGDDESRAAYVEELKAGGSEVDVSRILQAEELFNRATLLVKARRFAEAAQILDEAIQNNPDEGEFYAWRGFARFFAVPDKAMARRASNQDLDEALRRNPKCVAAYYYLGQIAKLSNDPSSALRNFKKTVELNPNHIDAQRELRLLGKK